MNRFILLFSLTFLAPLAVSYAQNADTTSIQIRNWRLEPGTYSSRGNGSYADYTTNWNSNPYTEGHLTYEGAFQMNYRFLFPSGHDPEYQPGYPLIVMMHGGGESGNCGANPHPDRNCNPSSNNNNNDLQLTHGGKLHMDAVTLANGKYPDDPTLPSRAFPGFVLFPQVTRGAWDEGAKLQQAIRIIRLLCKRHNIDQDRIYIHGLSAGGKATHVTLTQADWLFAASATMSPLNWSPALSTLSEIQNIPMWIFQGGRDGNPTPAQTEAFIRKMREVGGNVRYKVYSNLGHGTWNDAYNEPDFFTWFLSHRKSNIHVDFNNPNVCGTTGAGATLRLAPGFYAYQWERDGQIIPGAIGPVYLATVPGVYRARFSRISHTPTESEWNRWSDPVTVSEQTPPQPVVEHTGSLVLADLNGNNSVWVTVPEGYAKYTWTLNNGDVPTSTIYPGPAPNVVEIRGCGTNNGCAKNGAYRLIVEGFDQCPSHPSEPKYIATGTKDQARAIADAPNNFAAEILSPTTVRLSWRDRSPNERGFEIWRRKRQFVTDENYNIGWVMATLTQEDVTLFVDQGLEPGAQYWYKIRAVNNVGRSDYFPGNTPATDYHSLRVTMPGAVHVPSPPFNLTAQPEGLLSMRLTWQAPANTAGVKQYHIEFNGSTVQTNSNATEYVITSGLAVNTVYTFTVRAEDNYGNISTASSPALAHTYKTGLFYKYSTGDWNNLTNPSILATFAEPELTGWVSNFTLSPKTQENFFNFEFSGWFYIDQPGYYEFRTNSDDGSRLFLDHTGANTVVDNDGLHGSQNRQSETLTYNSVGPIPIMVRFFESTGGESLVVSYRRRNFNPGSNWSNWTTIPDNLLTSGNPPSNPTPPVAPGNLAANASGMQTIDLTWTHEVPGLLFEIQRSPSQSGTFKTVSNVSNTAFSDSELIPGTTYYYRLRAISGGSVSPFTAVVSATTTADEDAPTQPGNPRLIDGEDAVGFSTVAIEWTPESQDEADVKGYEVFVNGVLIDFTPVNSYQATGLEPGVDYEFHVVAIDLNDNRSAESGILSVTTRVGRTFVTTESASVLNDVNAWRDENDKSPASFDHHGQIFRVRHSLSVDKEWNVDGNVSKVIIEDGASVTVTTHPIKARVDIEGGGTLNLNHSTVPELVNLSPNSNVNYGNATAIRKAEYGNLGLMSAAAYKFPSGELTIRGNLTGVNGAVIEGVDGNASRLHIGGDIDMPGTSNIRDPKYSVDVTFTGTGNHEIETDGSLDLFRVSKTGAGVVTLKPATQGSTVTLNLGSTAGGGLSLPSGVEFNIGNNSLAIMGSGTINSSGETGVIASNNGNISITSNSSSSSHLRFKPGAQTLYNLTQDLSGSGDVVIENALRISDGVKIRRGDLVSDGNITLLSTPTHTANLQEIENGGRVIGDMNVQRHVDAKGRTYRYISASVEEVTVDKWQDFFDITGNFTGRSTGPGLSTQPSLYIREPEGWVPYPPALGTNQAPIQKGRGYAAFVRNTTPFTMDIAGEPHQGNVNFGPHLFAPQNGDEVNDWNLLGNPYPSTILWSNTNAWIKSDVGNIIAVRNNKNTSEGQFQYFDSGTELGTGMDPLEGGRIAPGQAFWVKATGPNPQVIITEKAKHTGQQTFYREGANKTSHLRIRLTQGAKTDAALLMVTSYGNDFYDAAYDGLKMANEGLFNLSTVTENNYAVAINNLGDSFCSKTVPVRIENVTAGSYALQIMSPETLFGAGSLVLKDKYLNSETAIDDETTYNFSITSAAATYRDRFEITFSRPQLSAAVRAETSISCDESARVTLKDTQAGASYAMRLGNDEVSETVTGTGNDISFEIPWTKLPQGASKLSVEAFFRGCSSTLIHDVVSVTRYAKPVIQAEDLSICAGASATISVSALGDAASYEWHDRDGQIKGASGAVYTTAPLYEEKGYLIYGKTPDGCKGAPILVTVNVDEVEIPEILHFNDTLYSSAFGERYTWFHNGNELSNDPSANFIIPTSDGSYTLSVAKGGCSKMSRSFVVTGVPEISVSNDFAVYPNPTTSNNIKLKVNAPGRQELRIRILDVVGREFHNVTADAPGGQSVLEVKPLQPLRPGVYFMAIESDMKVSTIKFIIEAR